MGKRLTAAEIKQIKTKLLTAANVKGCGNEEVANQIKLELFNKYFNTILDAYIPGRERPKRYFKPLFICPVCKKAQRKEHRFKDHLSGVHRYSIMDATKETEEQLKRQKEKTIVEHSTDGGKTFKPGYSPENSQLRQHVKIKAFNPE